MANGSSTLWWCRYAGSMVHGCPFWFPTLYESWDLYWGDYKNVAVFIALIEKREQEANSGPTHRPHSWPCQRPPRCMVREFSCSWWREQTGQACSPAALKVWSNDPKPLTDPSAMIPTPTVLRDEKCCEKSCWTQAKKMVRMGMNV